MPTGIGKFTDIHELPNPIVERAVKMLQDSQKTRHSEKINGLRKAAGD
jgi:hypothetical protein